MNLGFWNFYAFYKANRMFKESVSTVGDNLNYPMFHLGQHLQKLGHRVSTLDMDDLGSYDKIFFLDYPTLINGYFRRLIRMRHPDVNLIICEPPVVRADNYDVSKHEHFRRVSTWKKDLCEANPQKYFRYFLPNQLRFGKSAKSFRERKLCTMVNSFMFSVHPRELYSERIHAIRWFEANAPKDFDLIGVEWDKPLFTGRLSVVNFPLRFAYRRVKIFKHLKVKRFPSFIGPNRKSKAETLQAYRFCLAYENSKETDYISEKIFDCFFAGTVPVYFGAPNILDWIPANTFVDKRNFPTYEELHRYLSNMPENEYNGYLEAIQAFIHGPAIEQFTAQAYAENFVATFLKD